MPAKLILSLDGMVLKEFPLSKERITIGRKPHNDLVIDNLAISSEHAAVVTILHDSFLEDLESTNGLTVNGIPVKRHFLQNNDLIELGKYKIKYLSDHLVQATADDLDKTMVLARPPHPAAAPENAARPPVSVGTPAAEMPPTAAVSVSAPHAPAAAAPKTGVVQILNGANAGRELELVKSLTTLGKPNVQVAVLARRPHGYFITHVEGTQFPLVNGKSIGEHPCPLNDHDIIELAGIKMEFFFKD